MASKCFNDCHFWGNENASEYLVNKGMESSRGLSEKSISAASADRPSEKSLSA
jgi:hypothetical protein